MKLKSILITGASLMAITASASAANVLLNSDFAAGGANWTVAGDTGNSQFVTTSGLHVGFDGGDGFSWYTALATLTVTQTVVTAGTGDFVLSGDFLQRNDVAVPVSHGNASWTIELHDGGGEITEDSQTGTFPGTSTPGGGDPSQNVSKSYSNLAAGTYTVQYTIAGGQGAVDNIELDFTAVPEPSSAALLGLGGLALILRRRK